jgi:hypothetical protein
MSADNLTRRVTESRVKRSARHSPGDNERKEN